MLLHQWNITLNNLEIKSTYKIIIYCAIAVFLGACSSIFDPRVSEGIIEYEITYPGLEGDDFFMNLLPDKMVMKFKDNEFNSEISTAMGAFQTNLISNSNTYTFTNAVNLFNKRYQATVDKSSIAKVNKGFENASVIFLDDTKKIAGFNCKKALVIFGDVSGSDHYVYYTEEIKYTDPNWSTPFRDIPGVLMEYGIERYDIPMYFKAVKFEKAKLTKKDFEVSDDHEPIEFERLEAKINSVFESFQ